MNLLLRQTCPFILRSSITRITTTSIYFQQQQHQKNTSSFPRPKNIFENLPKSIQPYIRLSRIDKLAGAWLLYLPGTWSIAFAGTTLYNFALMGLFGVGTILMRGAGCTINDLWDKEFDRRVERTKSRPIASGEITERQAFIWAGVQLSLSFLILMQLNMPSIILGVISLIPVAIYPLMKRFTYWPQFFLGITFNW
jgi:4-hydroxybenzoate polyprenyl transferase